MLSFLLGAARLKPKCSKWLTNTEPVVILNIETELHKYASSPFKYKITPWPSSDHLTK